MHRHAFSTGTVPALRGSASGGTAPALRGGASFLLLTALVSGCGANLAPVLDVRNAPVVTAQGVAPSRPLVRDAIVRALASRTWQIAEERPDALVASVSAGGHDATVLVQYDERSFSITRVDSSPGLKYDGSYIHRRYNHWVDRLRASIEQELSQTTAAPAPAPAQAAATTATAAPATVAAEPAAAPMPAGPTDPALALPPAPPPAKP
jgi:hypothetical protein